MHARSNFCQIWQSGRVFTSSSHNYHRNCQQKQREDGPCVSHQESLPCKLSQDPLRVGCRQARVGTCSLVCRPCDLPCAWLVPRRPGYNPRGLQEGEGTAARAGREEVVRSIKAELYGGGEESNNDNLWICRLSGFSVFACWICLLKPALDCARYSLAVWVKMCGLQTELHTKWGFILVKRTTRKLFSYHREFHYFVLIMRSAYYYFRLSLFLFCI